MKKLSIFLLGITFLLGVCGCSNSNSNKIVGKKYEQKIEDMGIVTYSSYYFKDNGNVETEIKITMNDKELKNTSETYSYTIEDEIVKIADDYNSSYEISENCLISTDNDKVKYCE